MTRQITPRNILIMGAGGRDFHNFNVLFRDRPDIHVVAFTAGQIPFRDNRSYPPALAGANYPSGIPILLEKHLPEILRNGDIQEVVFSYSDVSHQQIMEVASLVVALGADFRLIRSEAAMLQSSRPVISVCAVRTGCGKSAVTRFLCRLLIEAGRQPVVVRHPMAYSQLELKAVEEYRTMEDLDRYECTLEEREEFEPLIRMGVPLFAGVDYAEILARAERAGDLLIWDGGNNDVPFFRPGLELVLVDPLRPGDERSFYPGLVNLIRGDVVILTKVDQASENGLKRVLSNIELFNPAAAVVSGLLNVTVEDLAILRNKRVVVVEDGPSMTHGGLLYGAATIVAHKGGVAEIVDPRPAAVGSLRDVYEEYPRLTAVVPAMGYSDDQLEDLRKTLLGVDCDLIVSATPVDLGRILQLEKPLVQVSYEFAEKPPGVLADIIHGFLETV